jgi:hypothetical protein
MAERRPRPEDFDTTGRYYAALLAWLEWRYPDQVDRAKKWRKIERKTGMPIKRPTKAAEPTPLQRAAAREWNEALERIGAGPKAETERRARIVTLVKKPTLTEKEATEFKRLSKEWRERARRHKEASERNKRTRQTWAERSGDREWRARWERRAEEQRQRYGLETTAEEAYFVHEFLGGDKGERKRQGELERVWAEQDAADEAQNAHWQAIRATRDAGKTEALRREYDRRAAAEATADRPRRKRKQAGIVESYDAQGRRVL